MEDLPGMFSTINEDLVAMMDECLQTLWAKLEADQRRTCEITFYEFRACWAPEFFREEGDHCDYVMDHRD